MSLTRKEFLNLAGIVAAGASLAACAPQSQTSIIDPQASQHYFWALNRLTYGPTPHQLARAAEIGLGNWIEEQLSPTAISDTYAEWQVSRLKLLHREANGLDGLEIKDMTEELRKGTLFRQIFSERQLFEQVVEFWTDHFNIHIGKDDVLPLKIVDDREVIRANALGSFSDILWASAHSPAMLVYLDNQTNHKNNPNENYAREVMELHTLGVNGGYTQNDVMELARCLTGWTVKEKFWWGDFTFDPDRHDDGTKTVLGEKILPSGITEAEDILQTLAAHPATAEHIATKLTRRFICDDPTADAPALLHTATQAFVNSNGDILTTLRVILLDGLVSQPEILKPKFKRPVNFIVSALRLLEAATNGDETLFRTLATMGQLPFEWPTPDGPPDYAQAWNKNLMPRWRFAMDLGRNAIPGVEINFEALIPLEAQTSVSGMLDWLSIRLLGVPYPAPEVITNSLRSDISQTAIIPALMAGILASPAFQYR